MSTLAAVDAVNEDIVALARAGVDLGLGWSNSPRRLQRELDGAVAALSRPMARGTALVDAVADPHVKLPAAYRSLLAVGLRHGEFTAPLEGLRRRATALAQGRAVVRRALVYPLLVVALAAVGVWLTASHLAPLEQEVHEEFRLEPGPRFSLLARVDAWRRPWMIPLAATLVGAGAGWAWRHRWLDRIRFPGIHGYEQTVEQSHLAYQLSLLTGSGVPLDEAVALVQGLAPQAGASPPGETAQRSASRPLFRWSITEPMDLPDRTTALATVHDAYRDLAGRQIRRLRFVVPAVACALIGGGAVLFYAWITFAPWSELLLKLTSPAAAA